jgi:hypothetical protein
MQQLLVDERNSKVDVNVARHWLPDLLQQLTQLIRRQVAMCLLKLRHVGLIHPIALSVKNLISFTGSCACYFHVLEIRVCQAFHHLGGLVEGG